MATVRKILHCSLAYLPEFGGDEDGDFDRPTGYTRIDGEDGGDLDGVLLWVPDDPIDPATPNGPDRHPAIVKIRQLARSLGCDYILFDEDGPEDLFLDRFVDGEVHHPGATLIRHYHPADPRVTAEPCPTCDADVGEPCRDGSCIADHACVARHPTCGKCANPAGQRAPCPFSEDVHNDPTDTCECCDACRSACALEI